MEYLWNSAWLQSHLEYFHFQQFFSFSYNVRLFPVLYRRWFTRFLPQVKRSLRTLLSTWQLQPMQLLNQPQLKPLMLKSFQFSYIYLSRKKTGFFKTARISNRKKIDGISFMSSRPDRPGIGSPYPTRVSVNFISIMDKLF